MGEVIPFPTEQALWRRYQDAFHRWELRGYRAEDEAAMIEAREKWERLYMRLYAA